jgi:hypothetical protein
MRLSKSKFTQGLGCHRALWWAVHEPDAPEREVGPALQAIFDQGTRVGELARAHVPGGHLVDFPYTESEKRIEATRVAIADGARVIYEAAFREDDVFVAVDILHRARGRTIIVYHAPFEIGRLRELQEAVPELADDLEDIIGRVVDLLPIVRAYVYHPDFGGRFSLKRVAPALVEGLRYDAMEIGEGGHASRALEALLLRPETTTKAERTRVRKALLAYCAQDTLATLGVLQRLRELA